MTKIIVCGHWLPFLSEKVENQAPNSTQNMQSLKGLLNAGESCSLAEKILTNVIKRLLFQLTISSV